MFNKPLKSDEHRVMLRSTLLLRHIYKSDVWQGAKLDVHGLKKLFRLW